MPFLEDFGGKWEGGRSWRWRVLPEREAREAIVRKLEQHMVRRKRVIPVIEHEFMELIYKPVYAVPLTYEDRRGVRHKCRKIVDGESGYLVYRYDRMEGLFG